MDRPGRHGPQLRLPAHSRALISREQAQAYATDELVDKLYGGAPDRLVASLLDRRRLTAEELDGLKKLVEELR